MDDAIRRALEVAAQAHYDAVNMRIHGHIWPKARDHIAFPGFVQDQAAAIAAFHDHMADQANSADEAIMHLKIAVAIRRAAGG